MLKLLFFPFYLCYKMIELPFRLIWWCIKASIRLTIIIGVAAFVLVLIMFML